MKYKSVDDFSTDLFEIPGKHFQKHISVEGNVRILFSGKFGIGKSFFLDHFFKNETQQKLLNGIKYRPFHIYPVDYSIAATEDIFKYIKYDVITTMLKQGIEPKTDDYRFIDALPSYLRGNLLKVMATLVYMIPKIGKDVFDSYEKLEQLQEHFKKFAKQATTTEGDKLIGYLEEIESKEGSIFENNIVTKLIGSVLQRVKEENKEENVLIIDDLDRVDPEHIFRILNVFAVHLRNAAETTDKLGFDKIILVCDINNLRNIFKARFGGETDFNGYIDKFYSIEVYAFDNRSTLHHIAETAFKSIYIHNENQFAFNYRSSFFDDPNLAVAVCEILIDYGFINLRNLIKRINHRIEIDMNKMIEFKFNKLVPQFEMPLFVNFMILKDIIGGYGALKENIQRIPAIAFVHLKTPVFCNQLMFFIYHERTIDTEGHASIHFDNKDLRMRVVPDMKKSLSQLLVYPMPGLPPSQHEYSVSQFKSLLIDFIDLLNNLDN